MEEIKTSMVQFPSNGYETPGYLARPAGTASFPAIVAIQEWWGLVPHIKDVADRFARAGFYTLAPDLYHGKTADEPDEARKMAMELDRQHAVDEIVAAMQYLQNRERVSPKKIGIVGWCMGGGLAIATGAQVGSSTAGPQAGALVVFYGAPRDMNIVRHIQAPVLGHFGASDHGITMETVQSFEHELDQSGIIHDIQVYKDAGHAFFNETRPEAYDPAAAQTAWQRTIDWFQKYLK